MSNGRVSLLEARTGVLPHPKQQTAEDEMTEQLLGEIKATVDALNVRMRDHIEESARFRNDANRLGLEMHRELDKLARDVAVMSETARNRQSENDRRFAWIWRVGTGSLLAAVASFFAWLVKE